MVNIDLLDKVLARIDENPDQWDQRFWAYSDYMTKDSITEQSIPCGTAFCVAGWAVLLNGHTIRMDGRTGTFTKSYDLISEAARKALDLTPEQADLLFWEHHTREDLQRIRDEFANG